MLEQYCVENCL